MARRSTVQTISSVLHADTARAATITAASTAVNHAAQLQASDKQRAENRHKGTKELAAKNAKSEQRILGTSV